MTCKLIEGAIVEGSGIVYESDSIADLVPAAQRRLAELCNDPDYEGWDWARRILIDEGLYTPESEADDA
jgi:hypothetical protein